MITSTTDYTKNKLPKNWQNFLEKRAELLRILEIQTQSVLYEKCKQLVQGLRALDLPQPTL